MMGLGQTVQTRDIAKALYSEQGVFEAVSPQGEVLRITCEPNASISSLVSLGASEGEWQVTKIANAPTGQTPQQPYSRTKTAGQ